MVFAQVCIFASNMRSIFLNSNSKFLDIFRLTGSPSLTRFFFHEVISIYHNNSTPKKSILDTKYSNTYMRNYLLSKKILKFAKCASLFLYFKLINHSYFKFYYTYLDKY